MKDCFGDKRNKISKILIIIGFILLVLFIICFIFRNNIFSIFKLNIPLLTGRIFEKKLNNQIYNIIIFFVLQLLSISFILIYLGFSLFSFKFQGIFKSIPNKKNQLFSKKFTKLFQKNFKLIVGIFLALVVTTFAFASNNSEGDDPYIIFRYVENIISGKGWVYNEGEFINASTSTLNTIIYVIFSLIYRENIPLFARIINTIFLFVASYILFLFFYNKRKYLGGISASLFIAINPHMIKGYGIESMLYIMLLMISVYFFIEKKITYMGISLALLCITRGDGIILAGLLFGLYFFTTKKIPYKSLALFILFLLPFLIFLYLYFGSITPNTLYVKMSHGKSGFWAPSFFLGLFYWIEKYFSHCFIISFITIPLFIGILNIYEKKLDTILILTWGFLYYLGYSLLHVPYYGQYYIPLIFPLAYFLGLGMQTLASNPILNGKIIKKIILCCFLFIILFPLIKIDYDVCKDLPHPSKEIYREIGLWIKQNTHKDASIAVNEIGIIGYYSQRRIIDILGLIMPNDIAYHLSKKNMTYWFYKYKPDYIVFHEKTNILFQKFEMPVATLKEFKDSYICTKKFNNPKYGKLYIYAKKSLQ